MKADAIKLLQKLEDYIEGGIEDYLKDNSIEDYIEHGEGLEDFENLIAIRRLLTFIHEDDFPWWDL